MARILIVNKYFAPDIGGVETVVRQYADWLAKAGERDVVILCCSKHFAWRTRATDDQGLKLVRCSSFGSLMGMPISVSFLFWFLYYAMRAAIVNIHYPFPIADIAMLLTPKRFKLFYTIHANISDKGWIGELVKRISFWGVRKADHIAVTSEPLSKQFFPDLQVQRSIIPLCLMEDGAGKEIEEVGSIDVPERYCLFFGRLSHYKGLDVLLEAAALRRSTEVPILIVGHGKLAPTIREALSASTAPKNVHFREHFSTESEKREFLSRADLLLFPSTTVAEAFGIVQLEAMNLGVPVINTYLGTGVEWVSLDGETGLTVPANDAQALANAIDRLTGDNALRAKFAAASRVRAQLFSEAAVSGSVLELFEINSSATLSTLPANRTSQEQLYAKDTMVHSVRDQITRS